MSEEDAKGMAQLLRTLEAKEAEIKARPKPEVRNTARPCIRAREVYKANNLAQAVDVHADRFRRL